MCVCKKNYTTSTLCFHLDGISLAINSYQGVLIVNKEALYGVKFPDLKLDHQLAPKVDNCLWHRRTNPGMEWEIAALC